MRCPLILIPAVLALWPAWAQPTPPGMQHGAGMPGETSLAAPARRIAAPPGAFGMKLPDLGVEIIAVRLSAAGAMLDLRYRVIDPEKAKPLMDDRITVGLVDPRTGAVATVPVDEQVGALRQHGSNIRPGQVLATLFGNPGRMLRKGDIVNLRLGDLEVTGLTIQG